MKRSYGFFYCLLLSLALATQTNAQQHFKTTSKSVIGYLEYVPRDYHQNSNRYPVVIFLHGKGEKAPNTRTYSVLKESSNEVTKLGPPYYVKKGTQFPFILISPQLKSNYRDWPLWYIMEVINHVKSTLRVDESRIYLTGLSLGGGGVWTAAESYPSVFAAVAPVCGSWNTVSRAKAIADTDLPVWAFHGDRDNVVPLSRTINMIQAINRYNPDPRAMYTIYGGVRHDAWAKAYRPDHSVHRPNVYEWLMSHRRGGGSTQHQEQEHHEQQDQKQEQRSNSAPVAYAGKDQTVTTNQTRAQFSGRGSDDDGKITRYQWSKISGGSIRMDGTTSSTLSVSNYQAGTYVFRFTVTDDKGASRYDLVRLHVKSAAKTGSSSTSSSSSGVLRAHAGPDRKLKLPTRYYSMAGGASSPDARITSYRWQQVDGPWLRLSDTNSRVMKITDVTTAGKRTFLLTVTDSKGRVAKDHVRIYFESK